MQTPIAIIANVRLSTTSSSSSSLSRGEDGGDVTVSLSGAVGVVGVSVLGAVVGVDRGPEGIIVSLPGIMEGVGEGPRGVTVSLLGIMEDLSEGPRGVIVSLSMPLPLPMIPPI